MTNTAPTKTDLQNGLKIIIAPRMRANAKRPDLRRDHG